MELEHYVYCNDSNRPTVSTNAISRPVPSNFQSSISDTLSFDHRSDLGDRYLVCSCKLIDHVRREESDLPCFDGTGSQWLQLLCGRQVHRNAAGDSYAAGVAPAQLSTCHESHNRCDMFSTWLADVLNVVRSVDAQLAKLWVAIWRRTREYLGSSLATIV